MPMTIEIERSKGYVTVHIDQRPKDGFIYESNDQEVEVFRNGDKSVSIQIKKNKGKEDKPKTLFRTKHVYKNLNECDNEDNNEDNDKDNKDDNDEECLPCFKDRVEKFMKATRETATKTIDVVRRIEGEFHRDIAAIDERVTNNKDEIDILQFHNKNLRAKLNSNDGIELPATTSAFKTPERERTPTPIPENFSLLPIVEAMGNKRGRKPPKVKSSPIMHMQARKKAKLQQSSAMEQLNKALKITPSNFECKKEPDSDNESS